MSEFIPNGCLSVLQARDFVGEQIFGADWLGIAEYRKCADAESEEAKIAAAYAPAKAAGQKLMALLYGTAPNFRDAVKVDVRIASGVLFPFPHYLWGSDKRAYFLANGRARASGASAMDWEPAPEVPNGYPWRYEGPIVINEAQLRAAIAAIAPAAKLATSSSAAVHPPLEKAGKHADRNAQWRELAIQELIANPKLKLESVASQVHKRASSDCSVTTVQRCLGSIEGLRDEAARRRAQKVGG